jgi:TIR domain
VAVADPQKGFHIFLSYRREGTSAHAGRLHDFLISGVDDQLGFSDEQIFMDIDTIQPGDDFRKVVAEAVASCDVFLAVIGKHWTDVKDGHGRRRLDNPADYVRLEIEAALEREIPVIPVLVDNAQLPTGTELPESISALVFRNAVELTDRRWRYDVGQLLFSLRRREEAVLGHAEPKRPPRSPEASVQAPPIAFPAKTDSRRLRADVDEAAFEHEWAERAPGFNAKQGRDHFKREFRLLWESLRIDESLLTAAYCHFESWWCVVAITNERLVIASAAGVQRSIRIEDIGWLSKPRLDFISRHLSSGDLEISFTSDEPSISLTQVGRVGDKDIVDEMIGVFKGLKQA